MTLAAARIMALTGAGSALLQHHHCHLDSQRIPAFLEATGHRNAQLYQRHGYQAHRPYRPARDSPTLHPMYREPAPR